MNNIHSNNSANLTSFQNFVTNNPDWEKTYSIYQRDDKVYKRIICRWQENATLQHKYRACINTTTGGIFLDCRRRKILAKHITLAFIRPIHTIIKTLFHISIIVPLSNEIYKLAKGKQNTKELVKNMIESTADIIRTPFYGVAMTITHIAGTILGCMSPNSLYSTREIVGKLERKLLRMEKIRFNPWLLSPCFSPMKILVKNDNTTQYEIESSLTGFAKDNIIFRRSV